MRELRGRWTYANAMATIAVFIALGGTSYAISKLPKNSVGTKQLKKNAVTTAKIADQAITAAKIEKGVLAGGQITASSPGTVSEATHAASADTAGHAASADNADTLGGLSAGDFAAAAEIQTPARTVVYDPSPGDPTFHNVTLLEAGVFQITGECAKNFNGSGADFALLSLSGPAGSSISGSHTGGGYVSSPDTNKTVITNAVSSGIPLGSAEVIAVAPNGQVVMVSGSAEVKDPAGDCIYGLTAIGP